MARARLVDRVWPAACLTAAGLLLHVHQLLGDRTFFRDVQIFYVPTKHYLAETIRRGELPQWWPFDGLGTPFLAQPMFSVFHPSTLYYLLLPFWTAFAAQDLTGTFLALFGTYLLARALRQPRLSAVLAACAFAANGYVMGLTEMTFMKLSAGTMPWYLWTLLIAIHRGGRWLLAPAAVMGLLLLAGDPQIAILAAAGGFALVLAARPGLRAALLGALSPVGGAFIAAIQLLPSLRIVPETDRATAPAGMHQWSLDWDHLVALVVPTKVDGFASHMTIGLAALALVGASLVALRRDRKIAALAGITLFGLWLALGDDWGLNLLARQYLPIWGKLRYSIKSTVLPLLTLALLAGEGLRQLRSRKRRRSALILGATAGAVLLACTTTDLWLQGTGRFTLAMSVLSGLGATLAALLLSRRSGRGTGLATALVCAQLLSFGLEALPTTSPELYEPSPMVKAMKRAGVGLTGPAFERVDDLDRTGNITPMRQKLSGGGMNSLFGAYFDLPVLLSYMPASSNRMREMWHVVEDPHALARIAGILGVGYIVETPVFAQRFGPALVDGDRVFAQDADSGFSLVHLARSLPRAYAVQRARTVGSSVEAGAILFGPSFHPGREVLIESGDRPDWSARPEVLSQPVQIESRTNSMVSLAADLPWDGFVVLNESWFNGWTATVDGRETPVLIANGFIRAVEVPSGHHSIVFRFETPGLRAGAACSAVSCLLLVLLWLLMRPRSLRTAESR